MTTFLKKIVLFSFPIVLLAFVFEGLLRRIPNDYTYKKTFLDQKAKTVEVLFLGSSHAYFGINPRFMSSKSFNAAYFSQTINYDFDILKKYDGQWDSLKYIVVPISYFTLYSKLETDIESWRVKNYMIYYGFNTSRNIKDYSEFLSNNFKINLQKLYAYYHVHQNPITCSDLGFGLDYKAEFKKDLQKAGPEAAKRHTISDLKYFEENKKQLNDLIQYAKNRHIKVLLFTPPAFSTYTDNLNKNQLDKTLKIIEIIKENNDNVLYTNFLTDTTFVEQDFYDADHLNDIGAKKLTLKINDSIAHK